MASAPVGRVVLFSIHPAYANAILDGTKLVEFRRTPLRGDVSHVVVYATSPVQQILGIFEVAGVVELSPTRAWQRYRKVGGIDLNSFERYYRDCSTAHVIQIRNPLRLDEPVSLVDLDPNLRPPQSFQYLRQEILTDGPFLLDGLATR